MKKIISILLLIACILCVSSCGGDTTVSPADATTFEEVSAILEANAETYRLSDDAEITQHEQFYSSDYNDYTNVFYSMCYAKMADGKYIKCVQMITTTDAEYFVRSYGANFDYVVRKGGLVLFGTSSFIAEFEAK